VPGGHNEGVDGRSDDFCSFTKAVEHLGDRWSFLIIREIYFHGSRGFNALVNTLPGISRSVLARRLRKLEIMGIIARQVAVGSRVGPYRLAPAGEQLLPTLLALSQWAEKWVPEDPATAQHDPDVVTFWLTLRAVEPRRLPDPSVVLAFDIGGPGSVPTWLVLEHGSAPSLCVDDPMLPPERYIQVEADAAALYPIARGLRSWQAAVTDRSIRLFGDPRLIRQLPDWFLPAEPNEPRRMHLAVDRANRTPAARRRYSNPLLR
jgi:DNA-binding HxlR family transcriptional regulator